MECNLDDQTSDLAHITNENDHPIDEFEKWLKEAEIHDDIDWVRVMNIATVHEETGVLNRNVMLRRFDRSGFVFVTERNSRKFKDVKGNPEVTATFFWRYKINGTLTIKQVRISGTASELPPGEIAKFHAEEGLVARIRCKICVCGQPCDWDELKKKHDEVLENFKNGTEKFEMNENYTAFLITPKELDFYYSQLNCIADRILYIKDNNEQWSHQHICA